jgi:radical SAM superfamily enzyme YgiQ (UPF0313 family)
VKNAFLEGCNNVKLYFMIGLPTETNEDLEGIVDLANKVLDEYFSVPKEVRNRGINVTVSTSSFVPKPFTPFQWQAQSTREELLEKQSMLKGSLKSKKTSYRWHNVNLSFLEGIFARGDRRLGQVIYEAWKSGCKFDSWDEHFKIDVWMEAFKKVNITPEFYANRKRDLDEVMPWDHIDVSVSKEFLKKEYLNSLEAKTTKHCRLECQNCGAAKFKGGVCVE